MLVLIYMEQYIIFIKKNINLINIYIKILRCKIVRSTYVEQYYELNQK